MGRKTIGFVAESLIDEEPAKKAEGFPKQAESEKIEPLAGVPEKPKPTRDELIAKVEGLIRETVETDSAVKRNKECKDEIKSLLIDDLALAEYECEFGKAKINENHSVSVDEESLAKELKADRRFAGLVKTKVVEYVDMDEAERIMYEEDGTEETPLTDIFQSHTTETVTKRINVTAPKAPKKKGGK